MKPLRILLIGLSVLLCLLVVVVGLAFLPSVQTWAVRRALAAQPDIRGDVQRVDVGLKQARFENLRVQRPGMLLTVPSLTLDLPMTSALRERILVRKAVAKGWVLDLTAPAALPPAKAAARQDPASSRVLATIGLAQVATSGGANTQSGTVSAESFSGIFQLLDLPVDLEIDAAELEGDVIFATEPGQPPGRAKVTLTGGQLGAGKKGRFTFTSVARLTGAQAAVNEVTVQGVVEAEMKTPRSFERITSDADVRATGPQFPNGANLRAEAKAERNGGKESYSFGLRSVENSGGKQLIEVRAHYPADTRHLTGTWKVDARDGDLAPFSLGVRLPGFIIQGDGSFETDNRFQEVHAIGRFEATVERLETLHPPLRAMRRVRARGDFDIVQHGSFVRVQRFHAEAFDAQPIASVHALQGLEFNASTGELKVADPARDLVHVKLEGVPLAWAQAFVTGVTFGGEDLEGEFVANARNGGVVLRTVEPLSVRKLALSQDGKPLLQRVDLSAEVSGEYFSDGWQAEAPEIILRTGDRVWLKLSVKAGQASDGDQPLKATGQYQVDLPGTLDQPALADYRALTAGQAFGDFSAVLTKSLQQFVTRLELRNLAAPASKSALPTVTLMVRADLHADGSMKLQAPLTLKQGERVSDLEATAEVKQLGIGHNVMAHIVSDILYAEDAQVLLAPLQSGSTPQGAKTPAPTRDTEPFWNSLSGELHLALKKVIYSPDVQAANVTGAIKIGADALTLENLRAVLGEESDARLSGGLSFDAKAREPYVLNGDVVVNNVNPGPILALLSPQKKPTAEGQFNVVGKFSGKAGTVDALANKTAADLKLTSRGGKFNGFAASAMGADLKQYQKGASTLASIVGFAAEMMGKSEVASYADRLRAANDVLRRFVEIPFDQLNLEVSHKPGEATRIKDFSLISPELRMVGFGGIDDTQGLSWLQRPLKLELQMAVRGDQARDMKVLGVLKDQPDTLGYVPLSEKIPIDGSLSNLGTKALVNLLTKPLATAPEE